MDRESCSIKNSHRIKHLATGAHAGLFERQVAVMVEGLFHELAESTCPFRANEGVGGEGYPAQPL